jgi:prepilin signal peptidase PulO-like enzyme (type II secretory pathway)
MQHKTLRIIYWVITILFVLFLGFGAVMELLQTPDAQKVIVDLGYPTYLNYILGIAKILGGIALIQWSYKAVKEWAYAGFTIDILGASASTFFVTKSIGMALFTCVFLIPLFLSYWLWKKTDKTT